MSESELCRVHKEFIEVMIMITSEINSKCKDDQNISQVEVSRRVAEYLKSVDLNDLIPGVMEHKPNGNKFNLKIITRFPGSGILDL
jgi:hypothetical protein